MIQTHKNPYDIYEESIQRILNEKKYVREIDTQPIHFENKSYIIHLLQLGNAPVHAPTLAFVAGVHGLESIGVDVLLNFIQSLLHQMQWSPSVTHLLEEVRLIFLPILNPSGIAKAYRSNLNGVDLMRNAPIDALSKATPLVGGHRLSAHLPWYRGKKGTIEQETELLFRWCRTHINRGPMSLLVDIHSGFGMKDQIWYPYAGDKQSFPLLNDIMVLKGLFDEGYQHHHDYIFSQQSLHYITHGDLWDWIFNDQFWGSHKLFYPLTLELGSWLWLKKNPRQLLNRIGLFYPMVEHRRSRVLRQHTSLFEFFLRATQAWKYWARG